MFYYCNKSVYKWVKCQKQFRDAKQSRKTGFNTAISKVALEKKFCTNNIQEKIKTLLDKNDL